LVFEQLGQNVCLDARPNALGIAVVIVGLVAMWLQRPGPRSIAVRLREEPER
jgi:hypothetical protein